VPPAAIEFVADLPKTLAGKIRNDIFHAANRHRFM